ncbi:MarR family winged helix-turn-helix transcriptional regulator [Nocardioides panacisoli]|uniref:MarR family winged helix-turn-helix transcriptional regulator n=1 Tax=Nocardioides panacisoli TaxID=627624 RepID=UPI001C637685|nr:MarR family winged helix-turn-helix transcriptional regulator [Nocardioides panacisoli]QYJ03661.1 MarR family winged helix-turn-helix transcriptional regulator [Nocardioides panacisoli]
MTTWLDEDQQRAWRAWLNAHAQLSARLGRELQAASGLSLADYEVLVALTDVPDHRMRMFELTDAVQWEKSRLSKQISRMTARGLVSRTECPDDRRGAHVALTAEGLAAIRSAAPGHADSVRSLVFDGLEDDEVRALEKFFGRVLDRVNG